jgi:hypothetical protein
MVYAESEVVQDSVFEQGKTSARVVVHFTVLVGRVDAVHSDGGNVNIQVARDGDERYLPGPGTDYSDDDGIGPEVGLTGTLVGAEQEELDRIIVGQGQ